MASYLRLCAQAMLDEAAESAQWQAEAYARAKAAARATKNTKGRNLKEFFSTPTVPECAEWADAALLTAAASGDLRSLFEALANGANINTRDKNGCTSLYFACSNGHYDAVRHLLSYRADPSVPDNLGRFPCDAAHATRRSDIVEVLSFANQRGSR